MDATVRIWKHHSARRTGRLSLQRWQRDPERPDSGVEPDDFVIDAKNILDTDLNSDEKREFTIEIEAEKLQDDYDARSIPVVQRVRIPGVVKERVEGKMLGQVMAHEVLIQNGELNLSRTDFGPLPGRGPGLEFTRSYSNQASGRGFNALGEGWRHNYELRLVPISTVENAGGPIPRWVEQLKNRFFRPDEIPESTDEWTVVSVNGTIFKKYSDQWHPELGRHGELTESIFGFTYTSKDGTRYHYPMPSFLDEEE